MHNLFPFALRPYFRRGQHGSSMLWWRRIASGPGPWRPDENRRYTADRIYTAQRSVVLPMGSPKWSLFVSDHAGETLDAIPLRRFDEVNGHVPQSPSPPDPFVVIDPILQIPMLVSPVAYRTDNDFGTPGHITQEVLGGCSRFANRANGAVQYLDTLVRLGVISIYAEHRRHEVLGPLAKDLEGSPDLVLAQPGTVDLDAYRQSWDDLLKTSFHRSPKGAKMRGYPE
jgi:hypothetical protein